MSFNIATTPTLQAVATQDENRLAEDLRQRVEAAVHQAEQERDVVEAEAAHQRAVEHIQKLRKAERALSEYAREIRQSIQVRRENGIGALIEAAAAGQKPDFKALTEISTLDARSRHASAAIERLVETLIPRAHLAELREEAHAALTKARAFERIAQERAEKVLHNLRDAVSEEVVLPVDLSKGVSGVLLAYAAEYKAKAIRISEDADKVEGQMMARTGEPRRIR